MIKLYNFDELKPEEILNRDIRAEKNVEDVVDAIIADVRARGDDALKDYALKFDGATIENLQVTQAEIDEAFAGMDPYFLETLRQAIWRVRPVGVAAARRLLRAPDSALAMVLATARVPAMIRPARRATTGGRPVPPRAADSAA